MAYILFLGAVLFLGYYFYEYLRRFFPVLLEYHPLGDWIARVSYFGPANSILAGHDAVWSNEIHGYRLKIVHGSSSTISPDTNISQTTGTVNGDATLVTESSKNRNKYLVSYEREEKDLAIKEKLYISALNRDRPRKHPKIRNLPKVGYLPTLFEPLPYPVTLASLLQSVEDEKESIIPESAEKASDAQPISFTHEERISDETTEDVNTDQTNPASTQLTIKKKKKFPKIRGFFRKFSRKY